MEILENEYRKILKSPEVNYFFRKDNGYMSTWGKTLEEDPQYSPYGPFILDMEVSTVCHRGCKSCYKSLTPNGKNMSLETFKTIFSKLPKTLTQIAFGIGTISANEELFDIFKYCRENGIIPNVTINGSDMTPELYDKLAELCGAVAVSRYNDDVCFSAVYELTKRGLKQVNIHQIISEQTYSDCLELLDKAKTDIRLEGLNAIVFLALKPKGRGVTMKPLRSREAFKRVIDKAIKNKILFGFDSCSANNFINVVKDYPNFNKLEQLAEPCESCCFSLYISVDGIVYPCSFSEGVEEGINLLDPRITFEDAWSGRVACAWRDKLLSKNRSCPIYNLDLIDQMDQLEEVKDFVRDVKAMRTGL